MRSSYSEDDVTLLLKDITGLVEPQPAEVRERLIQSGTHYCEMLPLEYKPTEQYMQIYRELLDTFAEQNADAVARLATQLFKEYGNRLVLVSLARAGIPIGILLKRYIKRYFKFDAPHYSISIIRGRGIDKNAMRSILSKYHTTRLVFVDGWTGKGAIYRQLQQATKNFCLTPKLAVLADPAGVADFCGTRKDLLVPSCCLNSTVSGLISRTFLRDDIISAKDYHGAVYYAELKDCDLSENFLSAIENKFSVCLFYKVDPGYADGAMKEVERIASEYGINDINLVKPSLGETTRVLLRRVPWKILISDEYKDSVEVRHIKRLAEEKNVEISYVPLKHYITVGLIKEMADT